LSAFVGFRHKHDVKYAVRKSFTFLTFYFSPPVLPKLTQLTRHYWMPLTDNIYPRIHTSIHTSSQLINQSINQWRVWWCEGP